MLEQLATAHSCSLYRIQAPADRGIAAYIASTPYSRSLCNNSLIVGVRYTDALRSACRDILVSLRNAKMLNINERNTAVLHVLRGGLNFGIREALSQAMHFNLHSSIFLSAQRQREAENSTNWHIIESSYLKLDCPSEVDLILGDVVATGTSLKHALTTTINAMRDQGASLRTVTLFTIGAEAAELLLQEAIQASRDVCGNLRSAIVVYLEGRFHCATEYTPVRVKITGTDLLRRDSLVAPEFLNSQYEDPRFPLERCTIYDAGSRAFSTDEYLRDVREYWEQVSTLASNGVSYKVLLEERFPGLGEGRFAGCDLKELSRSMICSIDYLRDIQSGE